MKEPGSDEGVARDSKPNSIPNGLEEVSGRREAVTELEDGDKNECPDIRVHDKSS